METGEKVIPLPASVLGAASLLGLTFLVHYKTFVWLYGRFTAPDSYYSHGFLVPAVTCVLIWTRRERLRQMPVKGNIAGLLLCVVALALHLAALRLKVHFLSGFALFLLVPAGVLFLFGVKVTRAVVMPLAFLVFMFPLPLVAINAVSFPLKSLVALSTAWVMRQWFGLPIELEGFRMLFPDSSLTIENPCSGLRSIIVMLALGFVFTSLSRASGPKRLLLFALSVPVAVTANILRVVVLGLAVYVYGEKMAEGFFHDLTGYIVFIVSFIVMRHLWRSFQPCGD